MSFESLCVALLSLLSIWAVLVIGDDESFIAVLGDNEVEKNIFNIIRTIVMDSNRNEQRIVIFCHGSMPDEFLQQLSFLETTVVTYDKTNQWKNSEDEQVVYKAAIVVISSQNFEEASETLGIMVNEEFYWDPHAKIIVYVEKLGTDEDIAKLFYTYWWNFSIYVILIQSEDQNTISISKYTPYVTKDYSLPIKYGCYSVKPSNTISVVNNVLPYAKCFNSCDVINYDKHSKDMFLQTCLSYEKKYYHIHSHIDSASLFNDQTRDLKGYTLVAFGSQIEPFLAININGTESTKYLGRDGRMWTNLAAHMNFTMILTNLTEQHLYQTLVQQVFDLAFRKLDIFMSPIYNMGLTFPPLEFTFTYEASGVCFLTHRSIFNASWHGLLNLEPMVLMLFVICFSLITLAFSTSLYTTNGVSGWYNLGKSFSYTMQIMTSMPIHWIPSRILFRVLIVVLIWSLFSINFLIQGSIISLLTVRKRGRELETMKDIVSSGYKIEGVASPDIILPDTSEIYKSLNNKITAIDGVYKCIDQLANDTKRICLADCAMANYLRKNKLTENGEHYLHVSFEQLHNYYLSYIITRNSPLRKTIDNFLIRAFEGGLVQKWKGERFEGITEESGKTKPLKFMNIKGIFYLYGLGVLLSICIFVLEKASYIFGKTDFNKIIKLKRFS